MTARDPGRSARSSAANALLIARREYLQRVRSRAFLVSTAIIALVAFLVGLAPVGIRLLDKEASSRIAIYVATPDFRIDAVAQANVALNGSALSGSGASKGFDIVAAIELPAARAQVERGELLGVLIIDRDPTGKLTFEYAANVSPAGRQATLMNIAAFWIGIQDALARSGQTTDDIYASFTVTPAGKAGEPAVPPPSETQAVDRTIVAWVLIILIFITVMTYGMWIAVSVAEEKSSRVMELILSAATPGQMLAGKVIGVGGAGLTQYGSVLLFGLLALGLQEPISGVVLGDRAGEGPPLQAFSPGVLLAFGALFMSGFALYSFLYAAAGSLVSRQEDVQQVAMPMILLSMGGYFLASFAVGGVESSWVVPLSFVPFFAPYLMLVRIILSGVGPLEILASLAILLATTAVAGWLAARVYRAGVLLYGQRPGLRAFVAAARSPR